MRERSSLELLGSCFRQYRGLLIVYGISLCINLLIFLLYRLDMEPFLYGTLISLTLWLIWFVIVFGKEKKRAGERARAIAGILSEWNQLPQAEGLLEQDYQDMIRRLGDEIEQVTAIFAAEKQDMSDYYTAWVHQIKTPIAVMRMQLAGEVNDQTKALSAELFRIEQYVEMVLTYIRLDAEGNDLVLETYALDDLIRQTIRKYAPQFIYKKIGMNFEETGKQVVTDRKWFGCIIEQLISNAVKYTPKGTISIGLDERGRLMIRDTGIGIAAADLPRIFEKGYTGLNGRTDRRSSGLGLYLCKKAADKLSLKLTAESTPGVGSTFYIDFGEML